MPIFRGLLGLLLSVLMINKLIVLFTGYVFVISPGAHKVMLIYIMLVGITPALFMMSPVLLTRPLTGILTQYIPNFSFFFKIVLWGTIYFLLWIPIALFSGQHIKDVLSGSFLVLAPYASLIVCLYIFNTNNIEKVRYSIKCIVVTILFCNLMNALVKLALLLKGYTYGGGACQYLASGFPLTWLLLSLARGKIKYKTRIYLFLLISTMTLLSLFSLKRNAVLSLLINYLIFFRIMLRKNAIKTMLLASLAVIFFCGLAKYTGVDTKLTERFNYSISGNYKNDSIFDNSVSTRIAEIKSAYTTLKKQPIFFWVIGMGPGAGYEDIGYGLGNLNKLGEPHEIHNFWGIMIYRYGLLGLFLYLFLVTFSIRQFLQLTKHISKHTFSVFSPELIGVSVLINLITTLSISFGNEALYGNMLTGVFVALGLACLALHKIEQAKLS